MNVTYFKHRVCIVSIANESAHHGPGIGTGFHVGDGYIVTARHVVEHAQCLRVKGYFQQEIEVRRILYPSDQLVDIAILETNFDISHYMTRTAIVGASWTKTDYLPLGVEWDDFVGEELVMYDVIVMGFPPIPTAFPTLVTIRAQINAVADQYPVDERQASPYYILSGVPRGGFSGAPMLVDFGDGSFVLGVVTSALVRDSGIPETGFMAAVTIESVLSTLHEHGLYPAGNALSVKAFASELSSEEEELILGPEELRTALLEQVEEAIASVTSFECTNEADEDCGE